MSKTTNEPYESVDLHKKNNEIFIAQIFKDSSTNNEKEEDLYEKLLSGQKNSGVQINLKSQLENNIRTFNNLIEEYPNHIEYIEKNKNKQINYLNAEFGKIFPKNYTKQEKQDLMDGVIGKIQIEEMNKHTSRKLGKDIVNDSENLNNKPNVDINEIKPKQLDDGTNDTSKQKSGLEQGGDVFKILTKKYTNEQLARYMLQYQNKGIGKVDSDFDVDKFVKEAPDEIIKKIIKIQKINDSKSNITKAVGNFFSAIENMLNMGVKDVDIMKIHQAMSIAGKPSENKDITSNKAIDERLKYDFSFIKTEQITSAKIPNDKRIRNIKNNISKYVSANQQPKPRELNAAFKNISRPVPPPSKGGRER